jgi:hypothetical protein
MNCTCGTETDNGTLPVYSFVIMFWSFWKDKDELIAFSKVREYCAAERIFCCTRLFKLVEVFRLKSCEAKLRLMLAFSKGVKV